MGDSKCPYRSRRNAAHHAGGGNKMSAGRDDTLMMTVLPLLAKIGKLLNRPEYVEEATYQFLLRAG
ncbi:hypothetical protein KCP76_20925 [Salmonella enterica subsp. enterica serovar Weltevreden]|nr:hypothetical protein KCP76_20925 [Salmonella enterica subsp. enterica serovar Weltevreden]